MFLNEFEITRLKNEAIAENVMYKRIPEELYIYYFYHHGTMSETEYNRIRDIIMLHDYDAFIQFYKWYQESYMYNPNGLVYLPKKIFVFNPLTKESRNEDVFDRDNFYRINMVEWECG